MLLGLAKGTTLVTFGISRLVTSFLFISVPSGICFVFLSRGFSIFACCLIFQLVFAHAAVFSFTVDLSESTQLVYYLHRVALSRPTAPIRCKFSVIMFIAFHFSRLSGPFSFIFLHFVSLCFFFFFYQFKLPSIVRLYSLLQVAKKGFAFWQ